MSLSLDEQRRLSWKQKIWLNPELPVEQRVADEPFSRYAVGMTEALETMPERVADHDLKNKIVNGVPLTQKDVVLEEAADKGKFIKLIDANRELLAVIEPSEISGEYVYCCVFN